MNKNKNTANPKKSRLKIAEAIKTLRKASGLTQKELCEKTGVRQATIVDIEAGRNCTINTLIIVAEAIGGTVEISTLLKGRIAYKAK